MARTYSPTKGPPDDIREQSKAEHVPDPENWKPIPVHRSRRAVPAGIVQGVVCAINNRSLTFLRNPRARIWVHWANDVLPPKVKIGATIAVYGKIMTFGNGRSFQLVDSVVLNVRSAKKLGEQLSSSLEKFIVDPSTYTRGSAANGNGVA